MKVSLLNEKILFQKSAMVSDAIGNRIISHSITNLFSTFQAK